MRCDSQSKDPAMWERLLEHEKLTPDSGAPPPELVETMDEVDARIAAKLASEGGNNHFRGSPISFPQLANLAKEGIAELLTDNPENRVLVGLRTSCTTGDLTLTIYVPKGTRYHWNLRYLTITDLSRFKRHLASRLAYPIFDLD